MEHDVVGYIVNGKICDLHENILDKSRPIQKSSILGLDIIRHSCEHILAQAIKSIYKEANFASSHTTESGFIHTCEIIKNNEKINLSIKDLPAIEEKMKEIIRSNLVFKKSTMTKDEFLSKYPDRLKSIILETIDDNNISVYGQGDFVTLCRGPHIVNSSIIGEYFKLTSVSEIVWKDQKLQKIEALCFLNKEDLENYETSYELRTQNDHRKLGKEMELFSFSPLSPGCVFWHQKGIEMQEKMKWIIRKIAYRNFKEYSTPPLVKKELWQKTGHLDNYRENMFILEDICLKPMNCPCHVLLFKDKCVSYKDLPLRIAEFGSCFRNEDQGGIIGLKRVRNLTQDDGHIFCSMEHIKKEIIEFLKDADEIYRIFGFSEFLIKLATRPKKHIGDIDLWNKAEDLLKDSLSSRQFIIMEGDGAFYGPKIELHLKDNMGRMWQCGTIQLDFFLAERLEADYTDQNNSKQIPIILHRAILGSMERFIGILLENGPLPLWLRPTQVCILPISDKFMEYTKDVASVLRDNGITYEIDNDNETFNKRLKKNIDKHMDLFIIIGQKEQDEKTITVRYKNENISMDLDQFLQSYNFKLDI